MTRRWRCSRGRRAPICFACSSRSARITDPPSETISGDGDRFGLGVSPKRREDARFLIGKGAYLDDLVFPDVAHAVFVRSSHAHAGIGSVDVAQARKAPGVLAVLTAAEVAGDGLNDLPPTVEANAVTGERFRFTPMPLLARDEVRYVGQLIALVVAETHAQALDAAELVQVAYEAR